jgi:hypothetical protein
MERGVGVAISKAPGLDDSEEAPANGGKIVPRNKKEQIGRGADGWGRRRLGLTMRNVTVWSAGFNGNIFSPADLADSSWAVVG